MITRALSEAKIVVEGDEKEKYARMWDYSGELLRSNPRSTIKLGVVPAHEGPPLSDKFYVCLDACKKGFRAGCRQLIGLYGTFLKTYYAGKILTVVAQDENNHIFVIAYAIVDVENNDNLKLFLNLLHNDIGDYQENGWCFISNMQKGLIPAMQDLQRSSNSMQTWRG